MKLLKIGICICLFFSSIQSIDQQLLLFLHTQSDSFDDEEGLNVAYQALTAIMQKAAPILMSENIWQHVVLRKDRFKKGLQNKKSIQKSVLLMHKKVNEMLKKQKQDALAVNRLCDQVWYEQQYPELNNLDQNSYKHLLFDYFCYYIFDHFSGWKTYQLPEGYLLWIPSNKSHGFMVKDAQIKNRIELSNSNFLNRSLDLKNVLKRYLSTDRSIIWSFYATGHGFHQDREQMVAGVAGLTLEVFKSLLKFLNDSISTKVFVYSSCFGAGQNIIIPYQDQGQDLLLSYPVIVVSLTDAPVYVFGVPSGLKLPPYCFDNLLSQEDINNQGLKPYFLQNFTLFCDGVLSGKIDAKLAKTVNPYIQCQLKDCTILKIENIPLIRRTYASFFMILDDFQSCSITTKDQIIDLKNKKVCLWYINKYLETISIPKELPAFVSMIPGNQVHFTACLQASEIDFSELIRGLFLSIDDVQEQKIYLFDKIFCSALISNISSNLINQLDQVIVLPKGSWLPSFAQGDMSCHVCGQYQEQSFCICFNQNKQISSVQILDKEQVAILHDFRQLLLQQCELGNKVSVTKILSSQYFKKRDQLEQELLHVCKLKKVCK